jgi:threonylcarbamoyladenosine tRNA methylthiotransferase MtaB
VITEVITREDAVLSRPSEAPSVTILTIGCKLNQAESEAMALELSAAGCRVGDDAVPADVAIINTCAVTHVAERKARHLIRLARRVSPEARIIVTGCYAERAKREALLDLGADTVLGNDEKTRAARVLLDDLPRHDGQAIFGRLRTRSFVKIQEGCNDVCAFCIVPQTRGREQSVPVDDVIKAVKRAEADAVREVVLTGTQLGAYGRDLDGDQSLVELIGRVLRETTVPRLRLSSVQPQDVTPALLGLWDDPRLCPHFHIALQSGSDGVLDAMRRRYGTREFREAAEAIRSRIPEGAITTDVLVGFPGETDEDFATTKAFCRQVEFAALHVFPFSARAGTLAARMAEHIDAGRKRVRVQEALALGKDLRSRFLSRFEGKAMSVLFEQRVRESYWEGLTGNYIRVVVRSDDPLENRIAEVQLERPKGADLRGVLGEVLDN